jgi:protein gp37
MAENTKISWATHTFNPWIGCQKVGPACDGCYAEEMDQRWWGGSHWGPHAERKRTAPANWRPPLKWERQAILTGDRPRVFCLSLGDWADTAVPLRWQLDLAADVIVPTPHLDWLLLTKRIGNAPAMLRAMFPVGVPKNVWIGITVANQAEADRDIPRLLTLKRVWGISIVFLSVEPMLGPIVLRPEWLAGLDWILCGGGSGRCRERLPLSWPRALLEQTRGTDCAFHMKQLAEVEYPKTFRQFDLFPADLRVRELPLAARAEPQGASA